MWAPRLGRRHVPYGVTKSHLEFSCLPYLTGSEILNRVYILGVRFEIGHAKSSFWSEIVRVFSVMPALKITNTLIASAWR